MLQYISERMTPKPEYEQIIKNPYVLEFLDLPANEHFYESTLEQAYGRYTLAAFLKHQREGAHKIAQVRLKLDYILFRP